MQQFQSLGLEEALKAISAGIEAATRFGRKMAFVVTSKNGTRLASALMDGAHPRVLRQAERKAYTAALMERNTLAFKADLEERNGALDEWGDIELTTLQGGAVAKIGRITVGGVATGGAVLWEDEEVARVMLRAMGLEPVEDKRIKHYPKPTDAHVAAPHSMVADQMEVAKKQQQGTQNMTRKIAHLNLPKNFVAQGNAPITAVRIGNNVYTSGIPGVDTATGELPEDPEKQFALAFENMRRVLQDVRASLDDVGLVIVSIPDRAGRAFINKPWLEMWPGDNRPARKTNQAPLPEGVKVQISAVAVVGGKRETLGIPGLGHKDPLPMGAKIGNQVFVSVLTGEDPATGKSVEGDLAQIGRCFENCKLMIEAAGGTEDNINHSWVFLRDMALQKAMLDEYLRRFDRDGDRPARKTVPYELPPDAAIQIHMSGVVGAKRTNYEVPGIGHHDPIPMASRIGNILQSSGVYGIDEATNKNAVGFEKQLEHTISITRRLMEQVGGRPDQIAHLTIMVREFGHVPYIRERLRTLFPDLDNGPALHFINYKMPNDMEVQFHITAVLE